MDSYFIPWVIICTISMYFEAQIVPDWVPLSWLLILLTCPRILVAHLHFQVQQDAPCFSCTFWALPLKSTIFQRTLIPFSGEWYLEFQIWCLVCLFLPWYPKWHFYKHYFHLFTSMKLARPFYWKTHGSLFHFQVSSCAAFCFPESRFYLPVVISLVTSLLVAIN